MQATDAKLGESLVRARAISPTQLKQALEMQKNVGGNLGDILVKMGFIKDSELSGFLARQRHQSSVTSLEPDRIDEGLLAEIPREIVDRHLVVPLKSSQENVCLLAMSDPDDFEAIEEIQFLTSRRVEPVVAPKGAVQRALSRFYEKKERSAEEDGGDPASALAELPLEALFRAWIETQIEAGRIDAGELAERARRHAES